MNDAPEIDWNDPPPSTRATTDELREILQAALTFAHNRRVLPPEALRNMWRTSTRAPEWKLRRLISLILTNLYEAAKEERDMSEARATARARR